MQKLKKLFPLVGALLALALVSCGSDSDDDSKAAGSISYATTTVSKTTDDAAFTNELTKTGDGTVTYASSKETVATVNATTGEVTIVGAGETTITATVADSESYTYAVKTASYTLTVTAADTTPQKIAGSISYATTTVSKTTADEAFTNELTKTGDGTVSYASSKTDVAEVNTKNGLVTIKGAGETTITATVADSDTYTYATKTASYTLTVTQAYIGTKAPSEAKAVGDIVFTDGSATPYSADLTLTDAQKAAAIAVIFYVGTDCSNNSTSRNLGVGLAQNQSGSAWCLNSANAYNVNITTIQESDKDGSDNLSQIGEFLDDNDDTDAADKYPAFYFAKNYASQTGSNVSGTDYADGWYLPAKAELQKIYDILSTVNNALPACGGTTFDTSVLYWSSSQDASSDDRAYFLHFGTGEWGNYRKKYDSMLDTSIYVCAVRAFN